MSDEAIGPRIGQEIHELVRRLYPIPRSLTGEGVRETLRLLREVVPLELVEVPSGTRVLDWTIPPEWNVREAYLETPSGERLADFRQHNLHLVGYSVPVRERLPLAELRPHLHSLPEHPDWIPYRTSYYRRDWGFCLRHRTLRALEDGEYGAVIDATLDEGGSLTYGELLVAGRSEEEVLVSAHVCHPSLANDNLSGVATAALLARRLLEESPRLSYRFLFVPGTIGSIAWLARNEGGAVSRVRHGLVLTGVGSRGAITYKRSRRGDAAVDRAATHWLRGSGRPHRLRDFTPWGYDERQYGSPGFDLPVGCLMRIPHGEYAEYHTSADDPDFVNAESLAGSYAACRAIFEILEGEGRYVNTSPKGEPQLGRRGLYRQTGGDSLPGFELALLWVLNQSDGGPDLLAIAERSGLPFRAIRRAADALLEAELLREA